MGDDVIREQLRSTLIVAKQCIASFRNGSEYATQQYIDTVLCEIDEALDRLSPNLETKP